jgi:EmrB/QacA subfamily drug resistance transporter
LANDSTSTSDVNLHSGTVPKGGTSHATRTLLVLTGVALLVNYVETMVIPGIPTIETKLSTTATIAAWITSAYLIVGSAVSPLFGKLGDVFGKKRMFLVSLIFYIAGVGMAGFSPSIYFLIAARALQGVGFAIIPLGLAIVTDVFPKERVATAQGVISGTFAIGAAIGLIVGAYIVQDWGWPWAFHSALILSIILFGISAYILQKDTPRNTKESIDYAGAGILMGGITLLLLYATEGPTLGWLASEELAFLIPGAALFIGFFFFENTRSNPLIQLPLLKIRNVLVANLVGVISGLTMFSLFFALTFYAHYPTGFGLGLSVIETGWTLAPSTLVMLIAGPLVGRLTQRSGPKPVLLLGSALSLVGLTLFMLNRSTTLYVTLDLIISLAGVVSIIVPIVNMLAISLPRDTIAVGLGMNTMLRNLGGAIGPVIATVILTTYTTQVMAPVNGHLVPVSFGNATAFNYIFEIGIGLMVLCIAISLATKNYTFRKQVNGNSSNGTVSQESVQS